MILHFFCIFSLFLILPSSFLSFNSKISLIQKIKKQHLCFCHVMALCQDGERYLPNYCSAIVISFKEGLLYSYLLDCVPTELVKALAKTIFFLYLPSPKLAFVMYWLANSCVEQYQTSPFLKC